MKKVCLRSIQKNKVFKQSFVFNFLAFLNLKKTITLSGAILFLSLSSLNTSAATKSPKLTEEQYLREQAIKKSQMYQNFIQQNSAGHMSQVSYQPQGTQTNPANAGGGTVSTLGGQTALNGQEVNPIQAAQPVQQEVQAAAGGNRIINCWDEASKVYGVDPWLIFAYAKTESSFKPWATNENKGSSTIDRGLMQINSIWLPTLAKYNIKTEHLFDSCVSIFVGTWIIRQNINRYGYNYHGLVAYNVGNPFNPRTEGAARNYYRKLNENYVALTQAYRK